MLRDCVGSGRSRTALSVNPAAPSCMTSYQCRENLDCPRNFPPDANTWIAVAFSQNVRSPLVTRGDAIGKTRAGTAAAASHTTR